MFHGAMVAGGFDEAFVFALQDAYSQRRRSGPVDPLCAPYIRHEGGLCIKLTESVAAKIKRDMQKHWTKNRNDMNNMFSLCDIVEMGVTAYKWCSK